MRSPNLHRLQIKHIVLGAFVRHGSCCGDVQQAFENQRAITIAALWPFVIKYTENFRFLYDSGTIQDLTLLEARNGGQLIFFFFLYRTTHVRYYLQLVCRVFCFFVG
jgi:hypothetical protein